MAGCEGLRAMVSGTVVCPKPRRLGLLNPSSINDPIRPLRCPTNPFQSELGDYQAGTELLDIILTEGNSNNNNNNNNNNSHSNNDQVAWSPAYLCGSPPSRASNPVTQDERFGTGWKAAAPPPTPPSPSAARKGGCARMTFGHKPAAVRVEGFDCIPRDRRLSAVA